MNKGNEIVSKMIRLTKKEEKLIQEKCIDFNKILINNNEVPIRDSELVHTILELSMRRIKIDKKGVIILD